MKLGMPLQTQHIGFALQAYRFDHSVARATSFNGQAAAKRKAH